MPRIIFNPDIQALTCKVESEVSVTSMVAGGDTVLFDIMTVDSNIPSPIVES